MQCQRRGSSARLQQRRVAAGVYAGTGGCEQRQRAAHPQQRLALATARPQQFLISEVRSNAPQQRTSVDSRYKQSLPTVQRALDAAQT